MIILSEILGNLLCRRSKVTRGQNLIICLVLIGIFCSGWETALEKAMTLLTPPPSGGPAGKHTHVPVFHRRCDLNSGPVPKAWQCQRQHTLILLSASDGGLVEPHFTWPTGPAHLRKGGGVVTDIMASSSPEHINSSTMRTWLFTITYLDFLLSSASAFFLTTSGSNKVPKLATY